MHAWRWIGTALVVFCGLTGCSSTEHPVLKVPALVSIAVTPAQHSIAMGATLTLMANGTYSDNSTLDLTTIVTWSSSQTSCVSIAGAEATAEAAGSSIITATLDGIVGSTTLTVTPATSIVLAANFQALPAGMTDATDTTVSSLSLPTTVNSNDYNISLTGKLRVTTEQTVPITGSDSTWTKGAVQFANGSSSIGTINILSVRCPFKLTVHHAPTSATDTARQLLIKFGDTQVYLGGGGVTGATSTTGYSVTLDSTTSTTTCTSGTTDISIYGWNGTNSAGVRVYDLWIEQ